MRVPAPLDPASLAPVLVPSVAGARTLPAAAYVSPEVFAWERDVLLGGLWHGAGWNFLFWGAFHGFFMMVERLFLGKYLKNNLSII